MEFKIGGKVRLKKTIAYSDGDIPNGTICVLAKTSDLISEIIDPLGRKWTITTESIEPVDADGGKIAYAPNGAPLFWMPEPKKPVSIEEQLGLPKGVSIHDLPTSELYNPMRLTFKNGSSIEALSQKDDAVRGKNHFCDGFINGKIPNDLIVSPTEMERAMDRLLKALEKPSVKFGIKNFEQKLKEDKKLKFTFYVKEGTRPDKKCNGTIPTMTTTVVDASGKKATVTCDKADYNERQGVLEAIAQMACGGNFDKEYGKAVKKNKLIELHDRTCTYCGKVFDTIAEREEHEAWHVECRKARHERYLLRKRAKEIAFEEQAQKMAKEMMDAEKGAK